MFCEMFLSLAFKWSAYQSGVAPKQWYFGRNLLNKLSAAVFFIGFLLLKSLSFHSKNAWYYLFLTIPVSNVMYDFPQQIFGKLNGDRFLLKIFFHYVDNFNVI